MTRLFICAALLAAWSQLFAENVVFNPGFEMGTEGYALVRILEPGVNPELEFVPLKTDTTYAAAGKQSLKIENKNGEFFELHTKEFQLKPNTDYTVSVTAKSELNNAPIRVIIYNINGSKWNVHAREYQLTPEFKTYSWSFNTGDAGTAWHIQIAPGLHYNPNVPKSAIWLDEFSVGENSIKAQESLDAAVISDDRLYEKELGKANLTLKAYNRGTASVKRELTVCGVDEYTGEELFRKSFQVDFAPERGDEFHFSVPLTRYGGVRVNVTGADNVLPGFYTVIGKYEAKPINLMTEPCVGLNGGTNYQMPPRLAKSGYQVADAPFEKMFEYLSRMGCRMIREHDSGVSGTQWVALEPEQGKFDFSHLDRTLRLYQKYNIELFPVLGRVEFVEPFNGWSEVCTQPAWVRKLSPHQLPDFGGWNAGHIILPPLDAWYQYVKTVAAHLKGTVQAYEIVNEPNFHLRPNFYTDYLKSAHDAIRAADPKAKVVGLVISSDFGCNGIPWLQECVKLNGLQYVDAGGFHPYGAPELGSPKPADADIARVREALGKEGANLPLWNNELYCMFDSDSTDLYVLSQPQPHHIAWRFLVDLGEGISQSAPQAAAIGHIYKHILVPNFHSSQFLELVPSENFAVYNALARYFERVKPVYKKKYTSDVIVYGFEREDGPIAAIWNFGTQKGLSADLSGFEIMDLFGNPMPSGKCHVEKAPLYLKAGKLSRDEFFRQLKELAIQVANPITSVDSIRLFERNGEKLAVVELKNNSDEAQKGIVGISSDGISAKQLIRFNLNPSETISYEIPVQVLNPGAEKTEVRIICNGTLFRLPVKVIQNVSNVSDKWLKMDSAEVKVSRMGGKLVIEGRIADKTDAGISGERKPWETDSVELFLDADPLLLSSHPQVYTKKTIRFFITPRDPAEKQFEISGSLVSCKDCTLNVECTDTGYSFRLELPAVNFPGKYLGFEMIVNNADSANEKGKRKDAWANSGTPFCNRANFGIINF